MSQSILKTVCYHIQVVSLKKSVSEYCCLVPDWTMHCTFSFEHCLRKPTIRQKEKGMSVMAWFTPLSSTKILNKMYDGKDICVVFWQVGNQPIFFQPGLGHFIILVVCVFVLPYSTCTFLLSELPGHGEPDNCFCPTRRAVILSFLCLCGNSRFFFLRAFCGSLNFKH